ncbi:mitochondrial protein, implicated in respiratory complex assembly [Schizosaccharomyces pombe]|uniref:Uncharacterized protein C3H7.08c n=1 Tax=Schizosaccharomyces pombe (strain 972 / ATCC 24843) TaxID=284812 RepID=YNV8_SCHPO|nr:uncharacterized protein SPBC3H7.08c [Schizosaccharomyces pombe]O74383.1 RecName: Full=Uncharacterized protein C3H7.08c [Schizosaccharomyces pombe 972h-]CAA20304.1 conserved fungal protein [Schizosaccharomyces pombe]|eukprot:NP_595767.1 uncharacterized protein SPBC3H7.08c [Schizosaccharomyces pombe]
MSIMRSIMSNRLVRWSREYPELFITWCVMTYTFGVAGYMLGQRGLLVQHEDQVRIPSKNAHPWEDTKSSSGKSDESLDYSYKYYPRGDRSKEPRKAPSAIQYSTFPVKGVSEEVLERFSK